MKLTCKPGMIVQRENILLKLKTVILLKSFYDIKISTKQ